MEEYNGVWPRDPFTRSSKITQMVSSCFSRPFKFEYSTGRIGNIYAPEDCPDTCVNIVRGILNMMQITIKKSQNVYELQEVCFFHSKTTLLKGCVLFRCTSSMFLFILIYFQPSVMKKSCFSFTRKKMCVYVLKELLLLDILKTFVELLYVKCNTFKKKEVLAMNVFVILLPWYNYLIHLFVHCWY